MKAQHQTAPNTSGENFTPPFPPLWLFTKPTLTTEEYAYYRGIAPQTARVHACYERGEVRPRRINGRLHWNTESVKSLMGVAA
jgi:hypothetical protein